MATGYAYNGQCYKTTAAVLEKFKTQFPSWEGGSLTTLTSASVTGSNLTYSISTKPPTSNTATNRSGTITLATCEHIPASMTDTMSGLLFAALVAFFTAFFLRKAIRKFTQFAGGFSHDF